MYIFERVSKHLAPEQLLKMGEIPPVAASFGLAIDQGQIFLGKEAQ
jgi:hypothetical protein